MSQQGDNSAPVNAPPSKNELPSQTENEQLQSPKDDKDFSVKPVASTNELGSLVFPTSELSEKKVDVEESSNYTGTQETGASFTSSVINMMNTIIGAGTLSLPSTVMDAGIGGAGLLLLVSLCLSLVGAHYLSAAAIYTKEDSYGFIGRRLLNKTVGYIADFFMVLFDFGISVGYCNIVFSQTVDLISNIFHIELSVVQGNLWVTSGWIVSIVVDCSS